MGLYWNVWIVVLAPSYETRITDAMVNLGWSVSPMDGVKVNAAPESKNSGVLLAYLINDLKGIKALDVNNKIVEILDKQNMKYYTVIVNEYSPYCCWRGSNISFNPPKENKTKILN